MILREPPAVCEVSTEIQRRENPTWKRVLDVCGVLVIAPILAPLLLLVAVYIKLVSRGPVLFVQSRVGWGGDEFRIFKFRTMHVPKVSRDAVHRQYVVRQASADGLLEKPDYQSELIPGGKWLRKFAIDELPQLLNVLLGSMSLVGPRPDVLQLDDYDDWQLRRFEVLPGMTGVWQISGKNQLTHDQMVHLDIEYIETRSLRRDLQIIAKTVFVIFAELKD